MEETKTEVLSVNGMEITFQQDRAMLDMQVSTAKAYPRNITRSVDNAIATVTVDFETAEACNYSVPRAGQPITGPSVHLARILAQYWGNLAVEKKVTGVDDKYVYAQTTVRDLETNYTVRVEVKKLIIQNEYVFQGGKRVKTGKMVRMSDDMITVTGNAAMAIAERNGIFAVIPGGHVKSVYKKAMAVVTGDISDEQKLIAKRKKVFDSLIDTYGVAEADVLAVVGKASIKHITGDDLIVLIGIGQAIKDGDTTADEAFRPKKANEAVEITTTELKALYELKKDLVKLDDQDNIERIIEKQEVKSYQKVKTLLESLKTAEVKEGELL